MRRGVTPRPAYAAPGWPRSGWWRRRPAEPGGDGGRAVRAPPRPRRRGSTCIRERDYHLVSRLDLAEQVAFVEQREPGYTTTAKSVTEVEDPGRVAGHGLGGRGEVSFGDVQVTRQVVCFPPGARLTRAPRSATHPWTSRRAACRPGRSGGRYRTPSGPLGWPGRGSISAGRPTLPRARALDRPPAAVRHLRPLGHRRGLRRYAPGDGTAHRPLSTDGYDGGSRICRTRFPGGQGLALGHQAGQSRRRSSQCRLRPSSRPVRRNAGTVITRCPSRVPSFSWKPCWRGAPSDPDRRRLR